MTKIAGSESGSISQRHGSADPDPDPHQDPDTLLSLREEDIEKRSGQNEDLDIKNKKIFMELFFPMIIYKKACSR
jgi:hypothetical protein